jgi:hypothetical protein
MLGFRVESIAPVAHAVVPTLAFTLDVTAPSAVEAVLLHTQFRIEPLRRGYDAAAEDRLFDLFGAPADWGRTVHSLLWTHVDVTVPAFTGRTQVSLPVECSFDFNVAATKYFAALSAGEIPLTLLFSGTIFQRDADGRLQIARVSWEAEAACRLPVALWRELMDRYYPDAVWLSVRRNSFAKLEQYKRRQHLGTCDQALEMLLAAGTSQQTTVT